MENTNYYSNYQVFINFRGKDERFKILSHLKHHLKENNVNVFTDEDALGEPLENLFKQIPKSRIAIVIFTKNYAESNWCLDELVVIKKCIETEKLDFAIPIFYKVKASSVKKQSGKFGEKFLALQNSLLTEYGNKKKKTKSANSSIKRWKKALKFVAGMNGLTYEKKSSELEFVKKVIEKVKINLARIAEREERNSTPQQTTNLHISNSMGALSVERPNLEDYDQSVDSNFSSEHNGYRRTASFHNDRDRFYPLPVERVWEPEPERNRWSIQVAVRICCTVISCWCLTIGAENDPED